MINTKDVHQQFSEFFHEDKIKPYAYLVSKRMQDGHICIDADEVTENLSTLPYTKAIPPAQLPKLTELVTTDSTTIRPFVLHKNKLYFQRYFSYETRILEAIGYLLKEEKKSFDIRKAALEKHRDLLLDFKATFEIQGLPKEEQTDWQMVAIIQSVLHNFSIITGGPGTGKTTTVAKILALLFAMDANCNVALAAPTGKAAMRMAESLKNAELPVNDTIKDKLKSLSPNTIHRLLKYIPDSVNFKFNKSNPLPFDVVIVDEASMIDVALFAKLLDAIGPNTRIILLGDKNQLASVEAGSLFGDLCRATEKPNVFTQDSLKFINEFIPESGRKMNHEAIAKAAHPLSGHLVELQKSHRFNSTGGIGKFSRAIINNDTQALLEFATSTTDASVTLEPIENSNVFETFIDGYKDYILESDISKALQKFNQLRVLCAVREGPQGLYGINRAIENYLFKKNLLVPTGEFYENRPIIITQNNPDLKLFNGDIGILRKDHQGNMRAWFEDSGKVIRSVMPGYIANAETVFAMTVHKSQGSEYAEVLLMLPHHYGEKILTRELLYTAVTRAKEKVVVQTTPDLLLQTAAAQVKRTSGIIHRFEEIK